jgi:Protein of unknown function (DUF4238)
MTIRGSEPDENSTSSGPKRHHYVPRFLLRRFAEDVDAKKPTVFRLGTKTGANRRCSVENEAVIGHYYRVSDEIPLPPGLPEKTLGDIETLAADAIRNLEEQTGQLTLERCHALATFVVLQRKRTPAGRRQFTFMDELTTRLQTEINLNNAESRAEAMKATGDFESADQAERERLEALRLFHEGGVPIESTPDRQVAGIFLASSNVAETIALGRFSWYVLRPNGTQQFVLGDDPVALFDATQPEKPGGLGFGIPTVDTTLPISPAACLLLKNDGLGRIDDLPADDNLVRHVNLRSYAHADDCIWGSRLETLAGVRRDAKTSPDVLHTVRRRDGAAWIGERIPGLPGVYEFEGHFQDGRREKVRGFVDPNAQKPPNR